MSFRVVGSSGPELIDIPATRAPTLWKKVFRVLVYLSSYGAPFNEQ